MTGRTHSSARLGRGRALAAAALLGALSLSAVAPALAGPRAGGRSARPTRGAAADGPAPRLDAWKVLGPGGGGTTIGPTVSPHDPRLVVERCDMTGSYVTSDAGRSWRMFNLRAGVSSFAFDPRDPSVIYAANAAVWRSEDRGATWSMLFPDPAKNTVEHTSGDHAEYLLTTDDPSYPASGTTTEIQAVAVDPDDSNRLYAVFGSAFMSPQPSLLFASRDRGRSWERAGDFGRESVRALCVAEGGRVYAVCESAVYVGTGRGWERRAGPDGRAIAQASAGRAASGEPTIYATTEAVWKGATLEGGVYVSVDGGSTWRSVAAPIGAMVSEPGGEPPELRAVACAERAPRTAYVGVRGLRLGPGDSGLYNGIAKTSDGGASWSLVHKESNAPSANLKGSWIEPRAVTGAPNIFFDAPYSLGAAPTDPDVCYATDLFRTYRTTDGGRTWEQVNSVDEGDGRWASRGLDVTTCYGVHVDPFDRRRVFVTYTDIGLFRSEDGGRTWIGSTDGIPNTWRNTTYWVVFDPKVKGLMWGAFSATHDLPRPKMWRTRDPDTFDGGVATSTDGGRHWTVTSSGLPRGAVTHVLLDPASPPGRRTLYACVFGRGVYKSTDGGRTWTAKNDGIAQKQPFAWRLTRADDGTLYLVVARRSERGKIGDDGDGALYRSVDGGDHWAAMGLPSGTNGPMGLTVDPRDRSRLYLAAWGVARPQGDVGGGIFVSRDAGTTWRRVFDRSEHPYDVTVDPRDPRVLYTATFDAAAYRSTDAGETWARIRGYNFKWGHRVVPDPVRPGMVYVTTFGGSVWYGPAAGDPKAPEDIRPRPAGRR